MAQKDSEKQINNLNNKNIFPINFCEQCSYFDREHEDIEGWALCSQIEQYVKFNESCRLKKRI